MMHGKTHFHCAVLLIFVNYYYSPSLSFLLLRRWLQLQLQRCSKPLPRGRESSFCCPCSMKQAFSARLLQLLLNSPSFIHDKTIFASEASKATSIYLTYFCGIFVEFSKFASFKKSLNFRTQNDGPKEPNLASLAYF